MNRRFNLLILVSSLALLPISGLAGETNALATLQKSFTNQEQALLAGYDQALGSIMADSKQKGDLDLYLVAETERKRFGKEKTVPSISDANAAIQTVTANYYKARVGVLKQYISALDALVKTELKADRIESAKNVKTEKDKVAFELADLESKLPKPATKADNPSREASVSTPSPKETMLPGYPEAQSFGGHHYLAVHELATWHEAKKACNKMGGHLVVIKSKAVDDFVKKLSAGKALWIGCTDEMKHGDWRWVDGKKLSYLGWASGEPNNYAGKEFWGGTARDSTGWNDWPVNGYGAGMDGYICEWDK